MIVSVRLFATLREFAGSGELEIEVAEGATVRDAIEEIGRSPGMRDPIEKLKVVMAVNREYADMDVVLREGDELALIPPVSGGATAARPEPETGFLSSARPGRLICEARVVHKGGSVVLTEATLIAADGTAVVRATGSALVPIKQLERDA